MEVKSSIRRVSFLNVYLPPVWADRPEDDSEFEKFSSPNYSKVAEECD